MRTGTRTAAGDDSAHAEGQSRILDRPRTEGGLLPRMALAGVGGLLSFLALPPVGLWQLAFLAPVPLLLALRDARPRRGIALGLTYGLIGYGLTLYWILLFGELAWASLTLLAGLSTALFGGLFTLIERRGQPLLTAFAVASLWTTIDWLRGLWPLGGFTWGSLGISQVSNGITVRIAVVAGVWGVTFLVVFVASLLADAASVGRSAGGRLGSLGLAGFVVFAPILIPFAGTTGREIDVAAIQIDFRGVVENAPSREAGDIAVTRANLRLHDSLTERPPDLAIWGESALDPASIEILPEVRRRIAAVGSPVLTGATSTDLSRPSADGPLYNQAVVFDEEGVTRDIYRKTHLVPFGEFIPWKSVVGWISALEQIAYELTPGERLDALSAPGLPAFGTPICFENAFPALDRELVRQGARFLVVLTNNASYGETAASAQHLQMSRMRAIEDGRWVVHAAVSGISAFIDSTGQSYGETNLFEPGVIRRTIRASSDLTPYVRFGDWLPLVTLVLTLGFAIRGAFRGRTTRST